MRSDDVALERRRGRRLPKAIVAGLGAVVAAALCLGLVDLPPKPAWALSAAALTAEIVPASPPPPRLCFHGSGGELLDFAPRQHCP